MSGIIAASRVRGGVQLNTFIANLGALYNTAQSLYDNVISPDLGILVSDIQNFIVDSNNTIGFFIEKDYKLRTNVINNENIKFYVDLDEHLVDSETNLQRQNNNSFFYLPSDNPDDFSYRGNPNSLIVLPNSTNIGSTVGDNDVFAENTNGTLITNKILETVNGGNPDGDITEFINNGGSVVYKDLTDPNQTTDPNKATISEISTGGTYAVLNVSQPTHVNSLKYALVFADNVLLYAIGFSSGNMYVGNLLENTEQRIKIIIADEYFNISPYSNTIKVNTTTTPVIYQNATAYYKLDETSGYAIDVVNGHNFIPIGGVTQGVTGKINTGYELDGIDGKLVAPLSIYDDFDNDNFTVSFWFKTSDVTKTQVLISDYDGVQFTNRKLLAAIDGNNENIVFGFGDNGSNIGINSTPILNNTFYFVTLKYNRNGVAELKLNDVSQGTHTFVDAPINENEIWIGERKPNPGNSGPAFPFDGIIDEVSFTNGQTTNATDTSRYNSGNGTTI